MPVQTGDAANAGTAGTTATPAATGAAASAATAGTAAAAAAPAAGASGETDTQRAIDAIIARERTRSNELIATQKAEFDRQMAELRSKLPATPAASGDTKQTDDAAIAAARAPLEAALTSEKTRSSTLEKTLLSTMIEAAAKDTLSPKTVSLLADGQVRFKADGTTEVIDASGQPRYTANGPMTVTELVAEITSKNDFLVPAAMRKGGDYRGTHPQPQSSVTDQIAQLESEGKFAEANRLKSKQLWAMPKPAAAGSAA